MRHQWKRLGIHGVGILVSLLLEGAYAAPLHYSESVSGDLDAVPTTAYSLGIGDNTVSGSTYLGVSVPGHSHFEADFDSFAFSLPAGSRLVGVQIAFTAALSNTISAYAEERLCTGVGYCLDDVLGYETVSFLGATPLAVDFGGAFPLTTGTYTLLAAGLGIGAVIDPSLPEWWSADYSWTLRLVAIPEPGDSWLLALALMVLVFIRRGRWNS